MRYLKKATTFNTHDTTYSKGDNGRHTINHGLELRIQLSLLQLSKHRDGAEASVITEKLNKLLKSNYTTRDIAYALERCHGAKFIGKRYVRAGKAYAFYFCYPNTSQRWKQWLRNYKQKQA